MPEKPTRTLDDAQRPAPRKHSSLASCQVLIALLLAVLVIATFWPGLNGGFVNWDDDRFILENTLIQPLTWSHLKEIVLQQHFEAYHPLHLLSYSLDYALFGLAPRGYKIHNLLLYLLSLLLLRLLLIRLGFPSWSSWLGVALFALHPLHVEVVVWASARKETLSLVFMLAAMLTFLRARSFRDPVYWLSLLCFFLSLLTKTSTVILPLLLLLVEVVLNKRRTGETIRRLGPFFLVAAIVGIYVISLWGEKSMIRSMAQPADIGARLALVCKTVAHYLAQLFVPVSLSHVYPIDRQGQFDRTALFGLAALLLLIVFAIRIRQPAVRLSILWFFVALLPVANLVPVYYFVQDRYAFIASLALVWLIVGLHQQLRLKEWPRLERAGAAAGLVILALLGWRSFGQAAFWKNSLSLWQHAVTTQPQSFYAHLGLGHTQRTSGNLEAAMTAYRQALALAPDFPMAQISLCVVEAQSHAANQKDHARAGRLVQESLQRAWTAAPALYGLTSHFLSSRLFHCAATVEARAIFLAAPSAADLVRLASNWTAMGQGQHARTLLEQAHRAGAQDASYFEVLAQALVLLKEQQRARAALKRSLTLKPRPPTQLVEAARQLARLGRREIVRLYLEQVSDPPPDLVEEVQKD